MCDSRIVPFVPLHMLRFVILTQHSCSTPKTQLWLQLHTDQTRGAVGGWSSMYKDTTSFEVRAMFNRLEGLLGGSGSRAPSYSPTVSVAPPPPAVDRQKSEVLVSLTRLRGRRAELEQAHESMGEFVRRIGVQKGESTRAVQEKLGELTHELELRVRRVVEQLDADERRVAQPVQAACAVLEGHLLDASRAQGMLERAADPGSALSGGVQLDIALREAERVLAQETGVPGMSYKDLSGPDPELMASLSLMDREQLAELHREQAAATVKIQQMHGSIEELKEVSGGCTRVLQEQVGSLQLQLRAETERSDRLQADLEAGEQGHTAKLEHLERRQQQAEAEWLHQIDEAKELAAQERARCSRYEDKINKLELKLEQEKAGADSQAEHHKLSWELQKASLEAVVEQHARAAAEASQALAVLEKQHVAQMQYTALLEKGLQSMMRDWYAGGQAASSEHDQYLYGIAGDQGEVITRHPKKAVEQRKRDERLSTRTAGTAKKKKEEERRKSLEPVSVPQVALAAENERLRRMMTGAHQATVGLVEPAARLAPIADNPDPSIARDASRDRSRSPERAQPWQDEVAAQYNKLCEGFLHSETTPHALKTVLMSESEKLRQRARSIDRVHTK